MPELPEVETVMRGLRARLEGRTIARAQVNRADLRFPIPPGLERRLTGARVTGFRRRAKYILMRLDGGDSVLLHLGMSGRVAVSAPGSNAPPPLHEHLVLVSDDGWRVGLVDPRRFGALDLMPTAEEDAHRLLASLGPEPLGAGFTAEVPVGFAGRQADADQGGAARPARRGGARQHLCQRGAVPRRDQPASLGAYHARRAGRAAGAGDPCDPGRGDRGGRVVLARLRAADGELGYFQHAWKVYGREGEACERCPGAPGCGFIRRIAQAGRSSFYCPRTQR